jgi:hypothetical protein
MMMQKQIGSFWQHAPIVERLMPQGVPLRAIQILLDPLFGEVAYRCEDCQEDEQTEYIQHNLANGSPFLLQFSMAVLAAVSMERRLRLLRVRPQFAY